jgi:hypothetical protein
MFENMSGFVGNAMHEERQRQARTHRTVAEATPTVSPWNIAYRRSRAALAAALLTVAARIAPMETMPNPDTATATPAP